MWFGMGSEEYAVIAMLRTPGLVDWKMRFWEFKKLARAAGYVIVDEVVQYKPHPLSATLFGRGKIDEIRSRAEERGADTLIVWNELRSIQKLNLERFTGLRVIDRYELVLEIFQKNAGDKLAKLQIELAFLEKLIPYFKLREKLIHGPRDKPFFRAGGEYGWVPKVAWLRKRRSRILEEIERLLREKIAQIRRRKALGFRIATIVGYYNAGKTSLFNALTGEEKLVSPQPFTTLSSKYSRLRGAEKILLVDTIGFVVDLNPKIISSFRINLEDMLEADMLLWVVDISENSDILEMRVRSTVEILDDNELLEKPIVIAANKIDLLTENDLGERIGFLRKLILRYVGSEYEIVPCSAEKGIGLENLIKVLINELGLTS